jgi:PAS domain S-box-containing protein
VKRQFSTGLSSLDCYLGGLAAGDSFLAITSKISYAELIISTSLAFAQRSKIPIFYLPSGDTYSRLLNGFPKIYNLKNPTASKDVSVIIQSFKRKISRDVKNGILLLDDLSLYRKVLKSETNVVEFFDMLTGIVQKNNNLLLSSVERTSMKKESLIVLKDSASVCVDLVLHQDRLYCVPRTLKGKYTPASLVPLRLDIDLSEKSGIVKSEPALNAESALTPQQENRIQTLHTQFDVVTDRLFQSASQPMILFAINGEYRELNKSAASLLGYSSEEFKLQNPISFVSAENQLLLRRFLVELRKRRTAAASVFVIRKNGKRFPVDIRASEIGGGTYLGILEDRSVEYKNLQLLNRNESEYRTIIHKMPSAIMIVEESEIVFANQALAILFGIPDNVDLNSLPISKFLAPETVRYFRKSIRTEGSISAPLSFAGECIRTDGIRFPAQLTVLPTTFGGKKLQQISFYDLSKQNEIVSKLTESEERYRELVEHTTEPVAVLDQRRFIYVNRAFTETIGIESAEKIHDQDFTVLLSQDVHEQCEELFKRVVSKSGKTQHAEFPCRLADNKRGVCSFTFVPIMAKGTIRVFVFMRDATELHTLRSELAQRNRDLQLLESILPVLSSSLDINKLIHTAVHKITDALSWNVIGLYRAEGTSKDLHLTYHKNLPEIIIKKLPILHSEEGIGGFIAKTLAPQEISVDHYPSYLPFKTIFKQSGLMRFCLIPLVTDERLIGILLLGTTSTNGKSRFSLEMLSILGKNFGNTLTNAQMFLQLSASEQTKQQLIESSPDILYTALPDGKFRSIGPRIQDLTGYTPIEYYKTNSLWLKLLHPDDKKIFLERIANLEQQHETFATEYRILPKGKAVYRWIRDTVTVARDMDGIAVSIFGTIQDITDERILIDNLQTENQISIDILTSLREGLIIFDHQLTCIRCNTSLVKLLGIPESMIVNVTAVELFAPFKHSHIESLLQDVLGGESVFIDDLQLPVAGESSQGFISVKLEPLRTPTGEIKGVVGILADVTQRKAFEHEIREAEQILSNVVDAMGDFLILTDLEGKVIQVNRAFLHVLGYSRQESNNCEFPYPWILEEEMGRYVLWISNLREHNWLHDFDMTMRAKDGRMIAVSLSTTLLRNHLGEPIAMLNLARDISDRRRLMRDLENRNKQIEMINRIITKANQTMDFHDIFDTVGEEVRNIVDCDTMHVDLLTHDGRALKTYATMNENSVHEGDIRSIESTVSQMVLGDKQPVIVSDFMSEERYKNLLPLGDGIRSQISVPISLKGKVFGTLNLGSREPFIFNEDHSSILLPVAQQIGVIIERILLFKQVSEDSAYIHNLLDSIDSVVYTVDTQMQIREVNKAWFEFLEEYGIFETRDYHGMDLFDAIPSEPLKIMFHNVVEPLLHGTIRIFSQEFVHATPRGERTFQLTINPMIIDRRIVGLVFTHTDISALKLTEAHLKKSNEQLLALNEISTLISSSLDFKKLLVSAIPLLKKVTGATAIVVYLQESGGSDLTLVHSVGIESYDIPNINRIQSSSSLTGQVFTKKKSMYLSDKAYTDDRIAIQFRPVLHHLCVEAIAITPLIANDQVFGAIDLFYSKTHIFSNQEQQLLTLVGNQFGTAVENTRLYNRLRSQLDQLTVLYGLSEQLTSTLSIDQIFQSVFEHIRKIIPFKSFRIYLYDGTMKIYTPVFHVEIIEGEEVFVSDPSQPASFEKGSPIEIALQTKHPYNTVDNRVLYIPMLSKESLIGVMSLESSETDGYTETRVQILESISNLAAIALEKGTLYEETLQKSTEIQRRNKELDDFTYVVSHDLKEPLISVEGFSRILQLDYSDVIQTEGKEYLDSIVGATTRMKGLIDDLLLLSRVSRPSESFGSVDVGEILAEIKTDMEYTIRQKNVQFIVPESIPPVFGNETQIKIVFRNLIANAVKFNNKPNPMVRIGFQNAENNYYLFSVTDNGIGIAKEFHEKIFIIFQRLHRREEYEGSGAGLAIVKKIVELHKGRIWVESEVGMGTSFFFTLPRPLIQEAKDL